MACLMLLIASVSTCYALGTNEDLSILPEAFEVHQSLNTSAAKDIDSFEVNGQHYLVVADHWDASRNKFNIDSKVYRWDDTREAFTLHQRLATNGATAVKTFCSDEGFFLVVSNYRGRSNSKPEVPRKCYARGDQFPTFEAGIRPPDSVSSVEDCAACCSTTPHCGFWRFDSDIEFCELFHMRQLRNFTSQGGHFMGQPASTVFSGTILGNCSQTRGRGRRLVMKGPRSASSMIYKLQGSFFVEYQSLDTTGAYDVEPFVIDHQQYLAIIQWGRLTVYRWEGSSSSFVEHQNLLVSSLPRDDGIALDMRDVEAFKMDGKQYLAVANHWDGFRFCVDSTVFRWEVSENHVHGAFVIQQRLPTTGASHIESFNVNEVHFLAVANYQSSRDLACKTDDTGSDAQSPLPGHSPYDVDSQIFRWDGTRFREHQLLRTQGAMSFEAFRMADFQFLAAGNHFNSMSKLYRFDEAVGYFAEFQSFDTNSAQAFKAFTINTDQYLAVANKVSGSEIYKAPLPCDVTNSTKQPGASCTCDDGYEGHIEWLGSVGRATGECRPAACNIENSDHAPGLDCDCKEGYEGSIEWTGSTPEGSCESAASMFGVPWKYVNVIFFVLVLILIATAISCLFISRKYYQRFTDEASAGESPADTSSTSKTESISATVVGSSI